MATLASDLITAAFIKAKIPEPTAAQTATGLISLNNMLSSWGAEFLVPVVTREDLTLVDGTAEYTIGSGGDIDTVRPIKIANAYLTDSDGYSYPLREMSVLEYNNISLKTTEARPIAYYFIPAKTSAIVIFNCEADTEYTVHFEFWKNFTEFALTTTAYTLPPEYKEAIVYNLAISFCDDWDKEVSKTIYARAVETKAIISNVRSTTRMIPKAKFDFAGGGSYDIDTDSWR